VEPRQAHAHQGRVLRPHLLTSFEKLRRDRQRFNVNPANGDRIRYRRTFHPRFFGRRFDIRLPHWTLYLLRNLRFLRRVIPFYRRDERRFLAWYERIVDGLQLNSEQTYPLWVDLLTAVRDVNGYAEIRLPRMQTVRARVDQLLPHPPDGGGRHPHRSLGVTHPFHECEPQRSQTKHESC